MTSDGWELVPSESTFNEELYNQIEKVAMRACQVCIGEKQLLFCLGPRRAPDKTARACASALSGNCNTCKERIPKFARLIGDGGKHFAFCQEISDPNLDKLRQMRQGAAAGNAVTDYQLIVIDSEFQAKFQPSVGDFDHVHFSYNQLTPDDVAAKLKELSVYLNGSFENRFQKLVDDPASLQVIQNELPNLVRPDHWRSVTAWAVSFVAKANGRLWSDLAAYEKFEIMTFAMMTGRSQGNMHFDMQQASNLVDFMGDAHDTSALRVMMDDRSDPETYQVSRVAELLRDRCVTSLCTVTLVWGVDGQPHKSDLDLHTMVGGEELYYGKKQVGKCKLDFDANASTVERNPAENISLNQVGTFTFRINNFKNRDHTDVPFQVVVKKPGFHEVHNGVWPAKQKAGEFLTVCTVTVTSEDLEEKPLELSDAEQKKLASKEAEWERLFGEPKSVVACEEDLELSLVKCAAAQSGFFPPPRGAQEVFSGMLKGKAAASKKPTLAKRCQLETLPGFMKYVTDNDCTVEVNTRNFVPAYVTRIETKTEVMLGKKYPINAYHRKNEPPQQPRSDEQSTVRFDESWGVPSRAKVHGFAEIGNVWFMVLKDAHLPNDPAWPLGAGMYPTHLAPEVHHHRSKWASFHSLVMPSTPESGVPLIGSALIGFPTFQFILNGREISVRSP
ncbi:unnamed protein product [Polarella glacialis]|uniref:Uncharacterized protein n=1 Tax=Polarella glacialis TaxID=89957 RepID=A0A813IYP1_POLGL|nr:unnamed protein product [Polarella glacialis]